MNYTKKLRIVNILNNFCVVYMCASIHNITESRDQYFNVKYNSRVIRMDIYRPLFVVEHSGKY